MQLRAYVTILLVDEKKENVLLLKRAANKSFAPNLITGVGGTVELEEGEAQDMWKTVERELEEEVGIKHSEVRDWYATLRFMREDEHGTHIITNVVGTWEGEPPASDDGVLAWYPINTLPVDELVPSQKHGIPFSLFRTADQGTALAVYKPSEFVVIENKF